MELEFTSKLTADLIDSMGSDLSIIKAARVSTQTQPKDGDEKLISFLMKNKHASPFEHCTATFLIDAPIVVAREWHRHRTQSYNEVSGRYSELKPKFYIPGTARPLIQQGKPGAYEFVPGTDKQQDQTKNRLQTVAIVAWDEYQELLELGVAREIARLVLPVNIYTSWYATANLRNWLGFLNLRASEFAMYEIRTLAQQIEKTLKVLFPWTMAAWEQSGRETI